jgi:hypothetical protein
MREVVEKLVLKYNSLIDELLILDDEFKLYLENASASKDIPLNEVADKMSLARENKRRLQTAIAERDYLVDKYLS